MRLSALYIFVLMLSGACGHSDTSTLTPGKTSPGGHMAGTNAEFDPWTADSIAYLRWGRPESPYRDEARYVRFLDSLLVTDSLPDALRERAMERRRIAMLNRPGSIAADFRYLEPNGKKSRLHDLNCPLTLLVFYDPECPHCDDILRRFADSETINKAIAEKNLTVVAIYAEGKRDVWDKTCNDLPANWIVGYDLTGILDKELYHLPAMPTPYLLDNVKRVILKDPTPDQLIRHLR